MLLDEWGRLHTVPPFALIGRDSSKVDISITHPSVSRSHAILELQEQSGRWRMTDLGSTNGTVVGKRRVSAGCELVNDRDHIVVGHVGFVFVLEPASLDPAIPPLIVPGVGSAAGPLLLFGFADGTGLAAYGGHSAHLDPIGYALVRRLAERAIAETDRDEATRGYVLHLELVYTLPWHGLYKATRPVAQVAAAVQRLFDREGIGCQLETASRHGYRLR